MRGSKDTQAALPSLLNTVPTPRHSIVFAGGEHWDQTRTPWSATFGCDGQGPGTCRLVPALTADFTAAFLAEYLRPEESERAPCTRRQPHGQRSRHRLAGS